MIHQTACVSFRRASQTLALFLLWASYGSVISHAASNSGQDRSLASPPPAAVTPVPSETGASGSLSQIQTVFIILLENHDWSSIVGNLSAPYINNQLLPMASHAEQYYSPLGLHPSLPNYIWLEAGDSLGRILKNEG